MLFLLLLVSVAAVSEAHLDYYGENFKFYPRSYNPQNDQPPTTVNIFKIYAPKQIFVSGVDKKDMKDLNLPDFTPKDKQMSSAPVSIIDRIISAGEPMPNDIMNNDPYFFKQYEESYNPLPSSVVSRKLPAYVEPEYTVINNGMRFNRGAMEMYPENNMIEPPRKTFSFVPDFNHDDDYDQGFVDDFGLGPHFNEYNDYSAEVTRFPDPYESPLLKTLRSPIFPLPSMSPLMSFFETIASNSQNDEKDLEGELRATVTYGEPEIVNESNENEPQEVEVEEIIPAEAMAEVAKAVVTSQQDDEDDNDVDVEINRNFVKTILPDNTSVTREVPNNSEENEDSIENEEPMDKIEVDVVKTILPDNTYTISETIKEEKISKE